MRLEDLTSLSSFNKINQCTTRETLIKVLARELEAYYVFNSNVKIIYGALELNDDGVDEEVQVVTSFSPTDLILLPDNVVRTLWGLEEISLMQLLEAVKPVEYWFIDVEIGIDRPVDDNSLYVKQCRESESSGTSVKHQPKQTALKIIGLMMLYLAANKPKLRVGKKPNKEQIRNYLIELATKYEVDAYGLSKSNEGILKEAMEYVPDEIHEE